MKHRKMPVVGLFVEGSRPTDPLRDDFGKMWKLLAGHCRQDIELRVVGISKGQIVRLSPADLPLKAGATQLYKKGQTQLVGGGDPLDVTIQREHDKSRMDRAIIAFDYWKPNQILPEDQMKWPCSMRPEVAFVLGHLAQSKYLADLFKDAARRLLVRYQSQSPLQPRSNGLCALELIFMDPMFEALFVSDEQTVRKALSVEKKRPKDWPKFRTHERELDKAVLDVAVYAAKGRRNAYISAKAHWGLQFVEAASTTSAIWEHPIMRRLCRVLAV